MRQTHLRLASLWLLIVPLGVLPLVRGGVPVSVTLLVTIAFLGLLAASWLRAVWLGSSVFVWSRSDLVFLVALAWVLIGLGRPAAPPEALYSVLILLGCLSAFLLARALAFEGLAVSLATSLAVLGGGLGLIGLLQEFGLLPHEWSGPSQFLASTFVNHNHFAAYLELALPLGVAVWSTARLSPAKRFILGVCCALMAVTFILSCSRGAWVSLASCTAVVFGWLALRRGQLIWSWRRTFLLILVLAAMGFVASQPPILARGMSLLEVSGDESFQIRRTIWQGTWNVVKEQPWVGHGVGSFAFIFPRHRPAGLFGTITQAFNEYLQTVAELGLIGLGIAACIGVLVVGRIVRLARLSRTPWKRSLAVGGLIGVSSVLVHSLVDSPWRIPAVAFTLAAVAGMLTGIRYHADPAPLRVVQAAGSSSRARWWLRWVTSAAVAGLVVTLLKPVAQVLIAEVWAQQAAAAQRAGDPETAVGLYRRASRVAPWWRQTHQRLAEQLVQRAWQRQGQERRRDFLQAADAYQHTLALLPDDAQSAYALAEVLKALGEFEEAGRWLAQAVAHDPRNPVYWKRLGEVRLMRGEAEPSAEAFQRAAALAKPHGFFPSLFAELDDPEHFVRMGESALFLGRLAMATTAFKIATHLDPNHPGARVGLALCAFHQGDVQAAHQLIGEVRSPADRAKWFAGVAQYRLLRGQPTEAAAAVDASLALDAANVLARHLQLLIAKRQQDEVRAQEALARLLALNQSPVFVRPNGDVSGPAVVWEPEHGAYAEGKRISNGWLLYTSSSIRQPFMVPPGKVRFRVTARGKAAQGLEPRMALSWNGRLLMTMEVNSQKWTAYEIETEVKPGESLLTVDFIDDPADLIARQATDLKLEKVVAIWGGP